MFKIGVKRFRLIAFGSDLLLMSRCHMRGVLQDSHLQSQLPKLHIQVVSLTQQVRPHQHDQIRWAASSSQVWNMSFQLFRVDRKLKAFKSKIGWLFSTRHACPNSLRCTHTEPYWSPYRTSKSLALPRRPLCKADARTSRSVCCSSPKDCHTAKLALSFLEISLLGTPAPHRQSYDRSWCWAHLKNLRNVPERCTVARNGRKTTDSDSTHTALFYACFVSMVRI